MLPVPDARAVAAHYKQLPEGERGKGFWTRLWPSATALCQFMAVHPQYIAGKTVWEIGAGLGLPALFATTFAKKVLGTDYAVDAVSNMKYAAKINGLQNFDALVWDWTGSMPAPDAEVVLISDANYDEATHPALQALLIQQLEAGRTVLLSTPVRLSGQGFLEPLLPYCVDRQQVGVELPLHVFAFKRSWA